MCGITGFIDEYTVPYEREQIVRKMVRSIAHRGPDEAAITSLGAVSFGTARLSIVDRAFGKQPMSASRGKKRGLITYNGEVYNFDELRHLLGQDGFPFQTRSDTEVVLAGHLLWGSRLVGHLDGMFAYGFWDEETKELTLVRDRFGIKPLYYCDFGDALVFASEPKSLFCHPRVGRQADLQTILEYFLHGSAFASGYSTQDHSFYEGVKALPPGHMLTWSKHNCRIKKYWSPLDEIGAAPISKQDAQDELAAHIEGSVRSMLMGEVPVGTALSGGLDSSLLTAYAARNMDEPLVSACITYSPRYDDPDATHAALMSRHLNQDQPKCHRLDYTYLPEETYLDSLDDLVGAFDEPHWEPRQLAMFENYRTLAKAGRTVVLTGEGADELFFGYYQKFPGFRTAGMASPHDFAALWQNRVPWVRRLLRPAFSAGLLSKHTIDDLVYSSIDSYLAPYWRETGDKLRAVQCWYMHTFLPWLLMDNDRCSMHHSIEGRFPFLANKVVSMALKMPPEWNTTIAEGMQEKVMLRRAADHILPRAIWRDRNKSPLPMPLATSYHEGIAKRLASAINQAPQEVWEFLDRPTVEWMVKSFRNSMSSVGLSGGEKLTRYVPLDERYQIRTSHLFGVLTLLRWYQICILSPGKDTSCSAMEGQYSGLHTDEMCLTVG